MKPNDSSQDRHLGFHSRNSVGKRVRQIYDHCHQDFSKDQKKSMYKKMEDNMFIFIFKELRVMCIFQVLRQLLRRQSILLQLYFIKVQGQGYIQLRLCVTFRISLGLGLPGSIAEVRYSVSVGNYSGAIDAEASHNHNSHSILLTYLFSSSFFFFLFFFSSVKPCHPPCSNGAVCADDGVCECPEGYYGTSCKHGNTTPPRSQTRCIDIVL